jgi:Flp pilus assembly protein TadD
LVAFASPEGEIAKNDQLADDRAKSGGEAFTKIIANAKYTGTIVQNPQPKGEDWAGFKTALEASDLADKDLIIRVLQMYSDPNKREEEIIKLSATYRALEKNILPSLRRCQLNVVYDKIGWSDDELKDLSKSKPDTLTVEELLFTATLYDDLSEKMRVYQLAAKQYPEDWRGPNNVGYVYYMQNDLANAQTNFEKASQLNENPVVLNNIGIITRINGDRDKAREILNSALSAGSEVKYNIGIIDIQDGRYDNAIGNMGGAPTFNKALAQCLNKDYGASLLTLDGSDDKESAIGYYLKAINGAKQNNLDMLTSNLKSAVSKDPSLKAKAAEDRVFVKFFENASFKAIVQ